MAKARSAADYSSGNHVDRVLCSMDRLLARTVGLLGRRVDRRRHAGHRSNWGRVSNCRPDRKVRGIAGKMGSSVEILGGRQIQLGPGPRLRSSMDQCSWFDALRADRGWQASSVLAAFGLEPERQAPNS